MGFLNRPTTSDSKPWREDPFSRFFSALMIAITGVLLGFQYWSPNKRVIPVVVSLMVFGIAWRLSMMAALNLLVFLLPYPKGTVFGSTNLAFVLLVFIIWLLRVSLQMSPRPRSTPIDLPISAFLLWAVLSFYNVQSAHALSEGLINFELLVACVLYFYLIVNSVHTQRDLERFHQAQLVTAFGIFVLAAWESRHAGQVLIPGLIDFSATVGHDFNTRDIRVGSSFRDYELLSEYCGIILLLVGFQLMRVRTQLGALILSLYALFNVYTMFTTVTRGVFVALGIALPIGFYLIRRRLNPVRFITTVVTIAVLAITGIVYGALVALVQPNMKKLVAYSSIAHMGFVTLGFFIFNELGVSGGLVQMISHGLVSGALFLYVGVLYDRLHTRDIGAYGGVINTMPYFGAFMVLFGMANAGLPGTSGFVGEFMVVLASFKANFWFAAVAALTLITGAAYTLWLVKRVVLGPVANEGVASLKDLNGREFLVLGVLAVAVIAMGVYPKPLTDVMEPTLQHLAHLMSVSKL